MTPSSLLLNSLLPTRYPGNVGGALLSPGASFAESRESVCTMLVEQGTDPRALSGADVYRVELDAFAAGLPDVSAIEGLFYDQLAALGLADLTRSCLNASLRRARQADRPGLSSGDRNANA